MLSDLVTDLARLQAVMNKLKGMRREIDAESFKEELEQGRLQVMVLGDRFSFLRTTLCGDNLQKSPLLSLDAAPAAQAGKDSIVEQQPFVVAIDLFG
jgi:hypothetical protein